MRKGDATLNKTETDLIRDGKLTFTVTEDGKYKVTLIRTGATATGKTPARAIDLLSKD